MIKRRIQHSVQQLLSEQAAVVLLGSRQVGKTTLALEIGRSCDSVYFDLEKPTDRVVLENADDFLPRYADKLVILDEIQRMPGIFEPIRGLIDTYRREGRGRGRFLFLGSASIDLLRQTSESLAGRIGYRELCPLNALEVWDYSADVMDRLWLRGGFPDSFLAMSDQSSMTWRRDFVRTYLQRDIPQFDSRVPEETLRRFWTMLAHSQGWASQCFETGIGPGYRYPHTEPLPGSFGGLADSTASSALVRQHQETAGAFSESLSSR